MRISRPSEIASCWFFADLASWAEVDSAKPTWLLLWISFVKDLRESFKSIVEWEAVEKTPSIAGIASEMEIREVRAGLRLLPLLGGPLKLWALHSFWIWVHFASQIRQFLAPVGGASFLQVVAWTQQFELAYHDISIVNLGRFHWC